VNIYSNGAIYLKHNQEKMKQKIKISNQRKRKIFGTLEWNLTQKLNKMISNEEISFYEHFSTKIEKKHLNLIYFLFMGNQIVERVIGSYNLKTGSITYASSLSKDIHQRYFGKVQRW
jgi:hypothetical protein